MLEQALSFLAAINWYTAGVALLAFFVGSYAILHALTYKRDPRAALGWIAISVLYPFLGPILYLLFGVNRIRTRALHEFSGRTQRETGVHPYPVSESSPPEWDPYRPLIRLGQAMTGLPLSTGNRVTALLSGDEAFASMLSAIRDAQVEVRLSTYIFKVDKVGRQFIQALIEAQKRGVSVHVLVDGAGSLYSLRSAVKILKRSGVCAERFLALSLLPPKLHMNLRNHRKLLIIDSGIAFAGGMNISREQSDSAAKDRRSIRDHHFKFEGEIVHQLSQLFAQDWHMATRTSLPVSEPSLGDLGTCLCRVIPDGPSEHMDCLLSVLIGAISIARERVDLVTPYFLPPRELITAIALAALRGVRVRVLIPKRNNFLVMSWAMQNMLWELLQPGVEVYAVEPPFLHSKLYCFDGCFSLVGSANLDARSLRLNFEQLIEIYDQNFAAQMEQEVDALVAQASPMTLQQVDGRPYYLRVRDAFFWLFTPYL